MAKFYAALGYDVEGPIRPLDEPDDFPVYHIRNDGGPDIAIFQRTAADAPTSNGGETLFFFEVENPDEVREKLRQFGLYTDAEEPRSYCEKVNPIRDPDGRLVGLDSFTLLRMAEFAKQRPWTTTALRQYKAGEYVVYEGKQYECLGDHVAQEGSPPPKLPPFWRLVGPAKTNPSAPR